MATRGTVIVLDASTVHYVCPNNTAENLAWTYTIPGGWFKQSSGISLNMLVNFTSNANFKYFRAYFGGVRFMEFTPPSGNQTAKINRMVFNSNSLNSQISEPQIWGNIVIGNQAPVTMAVNTASDVVINVTCQKTTATDAMIIEWLYLNFLP